MSSSAEEMFAVRSLCMAEAVAPPGQVEWMRSSGPPTDIAFQAVLLRRPGATVLINTGSPVAGSREATILAQNSTRAFDPPVLGTVDRDAVAQLARPASRLMTSPT